MHQMLPFTYECFPIKQDMFVMSVLRHLKGNLQFSLIFTIMAFDTSVLSSQYHLNMVPFFLTCSVGEKKGKQASSAIEAATGKCLYLRQAWTTCELHGTTEAKLVEMFHLLRRRYDQNQVSFQQCCVQWNTSSYLRRQCTLSLLLSQKNRRDLQSDGVCTLAGELGGEMASGGDEKRAEIA